MSKKSSSEIFLIIKTIRGGGGSCWRFSSPPKVAQTIYDPASETAVILGPGENELTFSVKGETRKKMEDILEKSKNMPTIRVIKMSPSELPSSVKELITKKKKKQSIPFIRGVKAWLDFVYSQ